MKYFEDIRIGDRLDLGSHTFTAEEIKAFARRFDPQPFHVSEEAAARSHFGALCASGWHSAAMWMRHCVDQRRRDDDEQIMRGETPARRGPSPGFRDLKWLKPVYAGDTLSFASEVVDTRLVRSRPGWGIVFSRNTAVNQSGDLVLSFSGTLFVECRSAKGNAA